MTADDGTPGTRPDPAADPSPDPRADRAAPAAGWAALPPGPAAARRAADHLVEVVRQADLEAQHRLAAADAEAASLLAAARAEARREREAARTDARTVLDAAREQARRELDEARRTASELLRTATDEVGRTFGSGPGRPDAVPLRDGDRVARLVWENARLGERLRSLNLELAEQLFPPDPVPQPADPPRDTPRHGAVQHAAPPDPDTDLPAPVAAASHRRPRRGGWGRFVHRRRRLVLGVCAALAVVCTLLGPQVVDLLSGSGFAVEGSESDRATTAIAQTVGRQGTDVVVLYRSADLTVDDAAFEAAVADVVAGLPAREVAAASSFWSTGSDAFVSADRRATYLALRLTGADEDANAELLATLAPALEVPDDVATTTLGGTAAVNLEINDQVEEDLVRAETLSAPLLAVLLVLVFGSLVAAGLPLLVGGLTVVGSLVLLRLLTTVTEVSVFAVNIVTLLGLGLSIDYALLVVSRYREEVRAGHDAAEALARTMATAGRSVVVSAMTVAVALTGLAFFPVVFLRSMAFGGVAAVVVAATASVTLLPAALAMLGPRVDAWRVPLPRLRRRPDDPDRAGAWERLARTVMDRPVLFTVAVSAVLLALASPVLGVQFGGIDARQLPADAGSRVVQEQLERDFPALRLDPVTVLVQGSAQQAAGVSAAVAATPGVEAVTQAAAGGGATLLEVAYAGEAVDDGARDVVERLRALPVPDGATVLVGGYSAEQVDLRAAILDGLWKMGALTIVATFLLLFWAFGSLVLPVKAVLMNLLVIGASLGVVVLVFQDGYGSGLLGFESTGSVELTQPILVLAILFGLSTDYEVFLLSRIREIWDRTGDNTAAVAGGLQRTGPIITSAAALILVVILAFSTSQILFIKLIGIGMATAILLDATIVRAVLVPATMRLLGHRNWWAPAPLLALWERHRPPPEGDLPDDDVPAAPVHVPAPAAPDGGVDGGVDGVVEGTVVDLRTDDEARVVTP